MLDQILKFLGNDAWKGVGVIAGICVPFIIYGLMTGKKWLSGLLGGLFVLLVVFGLGMVVQQRVIPAPVPAPTPVPVPTSTPVVSGNVLSLKSLSYESIGWTNATVDADRPWFYFKALNDGKSGSQKYRIEYALPTKPTGVSQAGIAFVFPKADPLDLSGFRSMRVTITFGVREATCKVYMRDVYGGEDYVPLGPNVSAFRDVTTSTKETAQTASIPLDTNFQPVNRKLVKEFGCYVGDNRPEPDSNFTIEAIDFLN